MKRMSSPHPLDGLCVVETQIARQIVLDKYPGLLINFREIFLSEPRKHQLIEYLAIEHSGKFDENTLIPPRHAQCFYDVIPSSNIPEYHESVVDIEHETVVSTEVVDVQHHASLVL